MTINILNHTYHYTVKYSKRKTIGISLISSNEIAVKVPSKISKSAIERILIDKAKWIHTHAQKMAQREHDLKYINHTYQEGDLFYYLGQAITLKIVINPHHKKTVVVCENGYLLVTSSTPAIEVIQNAIYQFYKIKAEEFAIPLIQAYSNALNKSVQKIAFKNQSSRWGSCSSKGNLNFNTRLIMMPSVVFQYIIIHEMAHLIHMNHSKEFWNLVETMCPDYKAIQKWLKVNSHYFIL